MNPPSWKGSTQLYAFAGQSDFIECAQRIVRLDDAYAIHAKIRFDFDEVNCDSLLTECNSRREAAYTATNDERVGDRGHQWCPSFGSIPVMYRKSHAGGFARKGGRL